MDPAARQAILSIPQEHLKVAKAAEVSLYAQALELHLILLTPLDYACEVSPATIRYSHTELLNIWLMALLNGHLYFDGPGPTPVPDPSGACDEIGRPHLVHPTRGDRPVYNLAISMPPRHGKSYVVSEHLPAWFLTNYPEYSCLLASYEADFAAEWGGKVRDNINNHPEFGISISGGRSAARAKFELDGFRGYFKSAGVGGPITGKGGHLTIVDDPIKNGEEAMSSIIRAGLEVWWHSTLYNRRETWNDGTPGRVILMATRFHEDDLTGQRVPDKPKHGDRWALLNLMALFDPTDDEPVDPLGRKSGEALCPERYPARDLIELRDDSEEGAIWFEAQYQGHPSMDTGNLIKRPFNYYTLTEHEPGEAVYETTDRNGKTTLIKEKDCYRFGTLDTAGTDTKRSDFTVLCVVDVTKEEPRRAFVRAIERVRLTTEHHEKYVVDWYKKYNLRGLHIEDKTFGTNLIGRLVGKPGLIIQKLKADSSKIFRALPIQAEIIMEMLWFPAAASWRAEFEREITKFPKTTYDDQVDALAYGVQVYKSLPSWIAKKREPVTMEERVTAHRKELAKANTRKGRKRRIVPVIGRW